MFRAPCVNLAVPAVSSFLNLYFQFAGSRPPPHSYIFDSFEGLPEPDARTRHDQWKRGEYKFGYEEFFKRMDFFRIPREGYTAVKGFFSETLRGDTVQTGPLALVHIDCDLFDSTRLALSFIEEDIQQGTVVLFDDYYCSRGSPELGESGAFRDWISCDERWIAVPRHDYSFHGKAFILSKRLPDSKKQKLPMCVPSEAIG